jgi:CheY-like chemotaxis protein
MDVMMPILSGPETIQRMKGDPEYTNIPIILMSAVMPNFDRKVVPWDVFLRKPFEIDDLIETIRKLLNKTKA